MLLLLAGDFRQHGADSSLQCLYLRGQNHHLLAQQELAQALAPFRVLFQQANQIVEIFHCERHPSTPFWG
ncbi:hypothetical protein HRbin22_02218 [Candidatus Thermoflexus japonica]|uniref:Uncharacterized protein n=1 Tax=Candidatus Thermoflexus japonica TaxID=2035417 RepID=A0A2H5Y930_9CHLR|nr:hypothetical protein HRbin22_02218 [Candidatus Thermoflexus japonica]